MVTVFSNQGPLGYLGIALTPEVYNTLTTEPWVDPENPGPAPEIPAGSTSPQITNLRRIFTDAKKVYTLFNACQKKTVAIIIGAFETMFFDAIKLP